MFSQYLASSSVRQTFNLSSSFAKSQVEAPVPANIDNEKQIVLELDQLNQNMIMKVLLRVIKKISTFGDVNIAQAKMPKWMKNLHEMYMKTSHINIKIFILKIIINIPDAFSPFKSFWWICFVEMIGRGDEFGEGFNHVIQDLCLILILWLDESLMFCSVVEQNQIRFMFSFLCKHAPHKSKPILNINLKIIRVLVEKLKAFVIFPSDTVLGFVKESDDRLNINMTGYMLISICILNSVSPFISSASLNSLTEESFYTSLIDGMFKIEGKKFEIKTSVYKIASEVIGQVFFYLRSCNEDLLNVLLEKLNKRLDRVYSDSTVKSRDSFSMILNKISLRYPDIIAINSKRAMFILPNLTISSRVLILEAFSSVPTLSDKVDDLFVELKGTSQGLLRFLSHFNEGTQIATLLILTQISNRLSEEDVMYFLPLAMEVFLDHPIAKCRKLFFQLVFVLYRLFPMSVVISSNLKFAMLKGLSETEEDIRIGVTDFVKVSVLSSSNALERLGEVFRYITINAANCIIQSAKIRFFFMQPHCF